MDDFFNISLDCPVSLSPFIRTTQGLAYNDIRRRVRSRVPSGWRLCLSASALRPDHPFPLQTRPGQHPASRQPEELERPATEPKPASHTAFYRTVKLHPGCNLQSASVNLPVQLPHRPYYSNPLSIASFFFAFSSYLSSASSLPHRYTITSLTSRQKESGSRQEKKQPSPDSVQCPTTTIKAATVLHRMYEPPPCSSSSFLLCLCVMRPAIVSVLLFSPRSRDFWAGSGFASVSLRFAQWR
ncbi:hypothetical protein B0H66DRAFT_531781 [Apodospora peruviana]|uniref:Uncharacterized protein n=1 Tax=Apodospora peruviana TaxID=516989 RepID=A0AAE0M7S1_9PEZI|nr:hypothetical protein B0H66DRAFT_531781 [Apodospora peruviana]